MAALRIDQVRDRLRQLQILPGGNAEVTQEIIFRRRLCRYGTDSAHDARRLVRELIRGTQPKAKDFVLLEGAGHVGEFGGGGRCAAPGHKAPCTGQDSGGEREFAW